jgi:glyoxylase-like metal-dependent hydrolase (beta-lactamase superfamily II)
MRREEIIMRKVLTFILVVAAVQAGIVTSAFAQQKPPARGIVNITGQLYRAQNDNHYTVFLVTPEGIIMSDPINRDFSRWLKSEIATRFKVPVRYVLYTHKDWDHASGGVVFADTAEFVGHANMRAGVALPPGNPPLPEDAVKMDANRNGLIERSEATGQVAERFGLFDENGSGVLNGAELIRGSVNDVYLPSTTYRDKHTVTLGGKRVMMVHLGTAHTDDGSVLYFPDERTVFSADVLQVKRLPQNITPTIGAYIDALRTIMALDFDHAATGHALMGTKKDAAMSLQYLEDLATGVAAGIGAGRSLQEIQKTLMLDAYKSFERWDTHRAIHIAQAYAVLNGTPSAGTTRTN